MGMCTAIGQHFLDQCVVVFLFLVFVVCARFFRCVEAKQTVSPFFCEPHEVREIVCIGVLLLFIVYVSSRLQWQPTMEWLQCAFCTETILSRCSQVDLISQP